MCTGADQRNPDDVFKLLETLYLSFDNIARRRHVFKVETIGDCYVAACGIPLPQQDHAVRLVRFANECMIKMNTLTAELTEILGDDTAALQARIGLSTGPVTGGTEVEVSDPLIKSGRDTPSFLRFS